jgi:hypothetical protein
MRRIVQETRILDQASHERMSGAAVLCCVQAPSGSYALESQVDPSILLQQDSRVEPALTDGVTIRQRLGSWLLTGLPSSTRRGRGCCLRIDILLPRR